MKLITKFRSYSQNSKIIIKNTFGAFVVRGFSLIISVLTTPAFISYFNNNEVLGVWFTMLSVLSWFLNFDLGIGNGLRNQLVKDLTNNDYQSAKYTLASGFFSTGIVTILLTVTGTIVISLVNLNNVFNVSSDLLTHNTLLISTLAIFTGLMFRFFLATISSIFFALQLSAVNNFLSLCVAILQLLFVLIFHFDNVNESMINLAIANLLISNIPIFFAGVIVFVKPLKMCRPKFTDLRKKRIKSILCVGGLFFVCQILYMCIANTNEIFITSLYGADYTTQYSFYYKLMSIMSMLITLGLTPVWSVVTKAVAEENYIWLKKLFIKIKKIGMFVFAVQFLIIPIMQNILNIWLGVGQVNVKLPTAISFACFFGVFVYSGMLSTIANGMTRLNIPIKGFFLGVVIKFAVDIFLYKYVDDWSLVVWSNVVAFLPYIIWQQIDLNNFFRKIKL